MSTEIPSTSGDNSEPRIVVTHYHDSMRAAIFEAQFGDMETAKKIARGEVDFVDVDPTELPESPTESGEE